MKDSPFAGLVRDASTHSSAASSFSNSELNDFGSLNCSCELEPAAARSAGRESADGSASSCSKMPRLERGSEISLPFTLKKPMSETVPIVVAETLCFLAFPLTDDSLFFLTTAIQSAVDFFVRPLF